MSLLTGPLVFGIAGRSKLNVVMRTIRCLVLFAPGPMHIPVGGPAMAGNNPGTRPEKPVALYLPAVTLFVARGLARLASPVGRGSYRASGMLHCPEMHSALR